MSVLKWAAVALWVVVAVIQASDANWSAAISSSFCAFLLLHVERPSR